MGTAFRVNKYGDSGLASVKVFDDKIIVTFDDPPQKFEILPEDAPKGVVLKNQKYIVTMSQENDKIRYIKPKPGSYLVKFKEFAHKEGEQPTFRVVEPTKWAGRHLEFTIVMKVIKGDYEGLELTRNLYYIFEKHDGDDAVQFGGKGSKNLEEALVALGIDMGEDFPAYSENILPALQEVLLKKDVTALAIVSDKGFCTSIEEAPQGI
jgi:hypothetical protein